jgi:CII-binding regulator of phage lambda lysogenization HflD
LALNLKIENEIIKTVALQSLTASHTSQITSHDGDITALQGRLETEETNIVDLETLTESHTTQINLNDGDILALQGRLEILDDRMDISEKSREFNTIVIRRFNNATSTVINLNELQVWVNDSNIMVEPTNNLNGYFENWSNKHVALEPLFYSVGLIYNNIISTALEAHSDGNANSTTNAIIIKNIPSTLISDIQSIVLYNRPGGDSIRAIGLVMELYNSTDDTDLNTILATTNVISQGLNCYRFDFPSIETYGGTFSTGNSTTQIAEIDFSLKEDATINVTDTEIQINGNVIICDSLTVGDVNVIYTLSNKQDTLTAGDNINIVDNFISSNGEVSQADLDLKQDLIQDGDLTIAKTDGLLTALDSTAKLASFNTFTGL